MKLTCALISTFLIAGLTACATEKTSSSDTSNENAVVSENLIQAFIDGYAEAKFNADFQVDITLIEEVNGGYKVKGTLSPGVRAEGSKRFSTKLREQMGSLTIEDFSRE